MLRAFRSKVCRIRNFGDGVPRTAALRAAIVIRDEEQALEDLTRGDSANPRWDNLSPENALGARFEKPFVSHRIGELHPYLRTP